MGSSNNGVSLIKSGLLLSGREPEMRLTPCQHTHQYKSRINDISSIESRTMIRVMTGWEDLDTDTLTLSSREVCPLFVPTGSNTSIWIPAAKFLENTSTTTTTTTIPPPTSTPIPVHLHSGLSTGSLLVILFITFSSIYFFGGVLALKLLRGAEGKEMIPNYDFWADVPYLCRDSSSPKERSHFNLEAASLVCTLSAD
uniref:Cation-dependent mannose-6-phosphate receptor n=1 Tax=Timema genevievae TaxID=629358 RepID=A0A7R9PP41_TIMGE|nr:unnamed protein product [Timema genevievae]